MNIEIKTIRSEDAPAIFQMIHQLSEHEGILHHRLPKEALERPAGQVFQY